MSEPVEEVNGQVPADIARIVLRPIASSAPIGFYAFGVGTILYPALELHARVLLCFSAPLQLVAGLIGYAAMMIFAAAWATIGLSSLTAPPGSRSAVLGIFMLVIAAIVVCIGGGAVRTRPLLSVPAGLAVLRYGFTGVYGLAGGSVFERISGWTGLPIVLISVYGRTAFPLEDTTGRTVLPLAPRCRVG